MQENETYDPTGRQLTVPADGLELWAEEFGAEGDPVVLLVMGAQAQGVQWNDGLVARLVAGGLRVIRYDHRDTGRSSVVDFAAHPYTVRDLATDALAVLDAVGARRAHVVGASLGGVIAQRLAVSHPERVLSLTVLSSQPLGTDTAAALARMLASEQPAADELPLPTPELMAALMASLPDPAAGPEGYLAARMPLWRVLHGPELPFDPAEYEAMERLVHARARDLRAGLNHTMAGAAGSGDTGELAGISAPTLVLHGTRDPLFPPAHARATAEAIPGARLVLVDGLGHSLPRALDARLAAEVLAHVRAVPGRP
ncbi:alpha/beta fold hydrolase [Kitasatospora sp. NPDC004289]